VTLEIDSSRLPVFHGVLGLVGENRSGGLLTNREHFSQRTEIAESVSSSLGDLVFDPQTSGGLLVTVDPASAGAAIAALRDGGVTAVDIGVAVEPLQKTLIFR
jgi:selenide,water dikinase